MPKQILPARMEGKEEIQRHVRLMRLKKYLKIMRTRNWRTAAIDRKERRKTALEDKLRNGV